MKKRSRILQALIVVALLLTACGGQTPNTDAVTLRVGWLGFPDTLNPAYAFLTEAYSMFDLVYSTLAVESTSGDYVAGLAAEWSVSDDGLIWTFKLREGVKWHNGEPLTAEQIAWNINAFINNTDGWVTNSGYIIGFIEAKVVDSTTLQIVTEYPISNMDYRVSFLYIVYPPDFESFTTPEDLQNFTNFSPVGSGAFKITTLDKDQRVIVLEPNPDFYGGAAKVDQIIYQTFDNSDALVQALKVGDIDLAVEVPDSAFTAVTGFANVQAVSLPGRNITELIVNSAPADRDPAPNRNPAITDPAVRLAIETAINKQDLVDVVLQGNGVPGVSIIPPTLGGGFWFNSDIQPVQFSISESNRILDEAGYVRGSDGIREKDGVRLEFRLQFPSDQPSYPRTADMIAGWLNEVGIKASPESVDPDTLVAITNPQADYDLVIWGWGSDPDPDFMLSVMTSDQYIEGGWSDSGYSNSAYDQMYLDQQQETDENARQKIVWEMQSMLYQDRPYIVLYYSNNLQAYRSDRFTNFVQSPIGIDSVWSYLSVEPVR